MINIKKFIRNQLYYDEICLSEDNGCALYAPGPTFRGGQKVSEILAVANQAEIGLFSQLIELYTQVEHISLNWEIFDDEQDSAERDASPQFKQDAWIKENYFEKGYSWEAVKILLSGHLAISNLKSLLNIEDLKLTGVYQAATNLGLKPGSLRPIDFNEYAVACFKVEDGKLIDNVYLYTGFGGLPTKLYDMSITFEKYLELAYKAKCFNYWNLIYCEKDKVSNYELMKRFWPKIFPHLTPDLEEFGISY